MGERSAWCGSGPATDEGLRRRLRVRGLGALALRHPRRDVGPGGVVVDTSAMLLQTAHSSRYPGCVTSLGSRLTEVADDVVRQVDRVLIDCGWTSMATHPRLGLGSISAASAPRPVAAVAACVGGFHRTRGSSHSAYRSGWTGDAGRRRRGRRSTSVAAEDQVGSVEQLSEGARSQAVSHRGGARSEVQRFLADVEAGLTRLAATARRAGQSERRVGGQHVSRCRRSVRWSTVEDIQLFSLTRGWCVYESWQWVVMEWVEDVSAGAVPSRRDGQCGGPRWGHPAVLSLTRGVVYTNRGSRVVMERVEQRVEGSYRPRRDGQCGSPRWEYPDVSR